jgi:O-methyltransferase involved in polyketide biosynthesis
MSQICLQQQVQRHAKEIDLLIRNLLPQDPMRDWFFVELDKLAHKDVSSHLSLEEQNSSLRALQQLHHLVVSHHKRLGTHEGLTFNESALDSHLTVEARLPTSVRESTRRLRFSIQPSLLHESQRDNPTFDQVSPTAKVVAYLRGLDQSLQFDGDESLRHEGAAILEQIGITDTATHAAMSTLFQSRYHAMNAAIGMASGPASQIIEFAAGVSPRGYQWSQMSPGTIYVESDLPNLMIRKAKMVRNSLMRTASPHRGVLYYCATDVLNLDNMLEALNSIDTFMPFTIVTEGLLLYFTKDELKQFLENVAALLSLGYNATWITDIVTQENLGELFTSHPGVSRSVRKVFELTGRMIMADNPFQSEALVDDYLHEFGLCVDRTVSLRDVASRLNLSIGTTPSIREKVVGSRKIWTVSVSS